MTETKTPTKTLSKHQNRLLDSILDRALKNAENAVEALKNRDLLRADILLNLSIERLKDAQGVV